MDSSCGPINRRKHSLNDPHLHGFNFKVSSFILKAEKLFDFVLDSEKEKIEKLRSELTFMIRIVMEKGQSPSNK